MTTTRRVGLGVSLCVLSSVALLAQQSKEKSAYQQEMEKQWKLHPTLAIGAAGSRFQSEGNRRQAA